MQQHPCARFVQRLDPDHAEQALLRHITGLIPIVADVRRRQPCQSGSCTLIRFPINSSGEAQVVKSSGGR
jgi:hypothetical protein